jgi:hypothetical protein
MEQRRWRRFRPGRGRWGCGGGGFLLVITLGIVLSLFNAAFGLGVSARIPFTQSNITVAGSLGAKEKAPDSLPAYTHGRLGGNQNFVNNSTSLTIGPAQGAGLFVIGRQDGAPLIDLYVVFR